MLSQIQETDSTGDKGQYVPGAGDIEVNYSDALFKDIPEKLFPVEPGENQEIQVAGLGTVGVEVEYLDDIPPLVYRPAGDT